MAEKRYKINEVFYSLQGEGIRAGTPNIFIRFSGCNLKCSMAAGEKSPGGFDCDTEFESGHLLTAQEIVEYCNEVWEDRRKPPTGPGIIFTGGEPAIQLDNLLINALDSNGFSDFCFAIETNGSMDISHINGLDWITVSPKVAEHAIKQRKADEVKYVRTYGQAIPSTVVDAAFRIIVPAYCGTNMDAKTLEHCIQLVKDNPDWRLGMQMHKTWNVI